LLLYRIRVTDGLLGIYIFKKSINLIQGGGEHLMLRTSGKELKGYGTDFIDGQV
jgi:hypothetical protein